MKKQRIMGRPPKVTRKDVRVIRRATQARKALTCQALSERLGISYGTVAKISMGWQPKRFEGAQP
jgi:hypothetical protein